MNVRSRLRSAFTVTIDRPAAILAALFLVVLVPSVMIALTTPFTDFEANTYGMQGAALGGAWVIAEVVFAGILVALLFMFRRLPEWIQKWAKYMTIITVVMLIGAFANYADIFAPLLGTLAVATLLVEALTEHDLWWIVNNLLALAIAIAIAPLGARVFGVEALVVGLVGLSVYDWYFADRKSWMFDLGGMLVRNYLPVLVIIPKGLRFDWDKWFARRPDLPDGVEEAEAPDEDERPIEFGIGMADLLLPAMFAAAVAMEPTTLAVAGVPAAVAGVTVGVIVAAFRIRWKIIEHDGGAGMPPIATGALIGYAPFAMLAWVVALL